VPPDGRWNRPRCSPGDGALRTGITAVHTLLDTPEQMIAYSRLRAAGKLPIRVTAMPPYAAVETLHAHGIRTGFATNPLRFGAAKPLLRRLARSTDRRS